MGKLLTDTDELTTNMVANERGLSPLRVFVVLFSYSFRVRFDPDHTLDSLSLYHVAFSNRVM
jgi:hypothetical protein